FANQVVDWQNRSLVIKLNGLVTRTRTQVRGRSRTDGGQECLIPVGPRDRAVSNGDVWMLLIKLCDQSFTAIDVFGTSPYHIPELEVNAVFGLAGKRANQQYRRSDGDRGEEARSLRAQAWGFHRLGWVSFGSR